MKNDKRTIFGWAMYDWANSAYITVFGAVIGAFFTGTIMPDDKYWGLSGESLFSILVGIGSILLMLAMPILGAMADYASAKKRYLRNFAFLGSVFVLIIPFVPDGQVPLFLLIVLVGQFGFVAANVFYDGFLPEIATDDTVDKVSSRGFALGYLGGGLYLLLALVLISSASDEAGATLTESLAARISIFGSGIWWIIFSLYALARLPADGTTRDDRPGLREYVSIGFGRTLATTRKLRSFPHLLLFVVAFIFYNSGTGTVIAVSGPYAEDTLGLELETIALAFLIVQFIAFFGALMFGMVSDRIGPKRAVMITLVIWTGLAVMAYFIPEGSDSGFLMLAAVVGFVLGGVQALSRSLYSSMIPEEASAEFFGFFSVFSKLSGIGPLVFGAVSAITDSGRTAILSVAAFFIVGLALLARVDIDEARASRDRWSFDGAHADAD
ncbi:MAG: MFS transporter [Acidimicrobiia bacterium]|nr:MFS transporter [Acidimicrobiia bacterium]MDX2466045.1 MFS transporter [Acidimicrobiia bacterium]